MTSRHERSRDGSADAPGRGRLRVEVDGAVARIVLADAARRNALSHAMFDAIESALDEVRRAGCAAISIEAEGPAFCAGFDLRAAVEEPGALASFVSRLGGLCRMLRRMEAVSVAAVHGAALAGGAALVSACDVVLVSPEASIGYPAVRIGISPAVSLPTLRAGVGDGRARAMMLGGELLDGSAALRSGLAAALATDPAALRELTAATLRRLAAAGPAALRATKRSLADLDECLRDEVLEASVRTTLALVGSEECTARMRKALDSAGRR